MNGNDHLLFGRPQVTENCRQHLLLRTDILQKMVVGCTCLIERPLTWTALFNSGPDRCTHKY